MHPLYLSGTCVHCGHSTSHLIYILLSTSYRVSSHSCYTPHLNTQYYVYLPLSTHCSGSFIYLLSTTYKKKISLLVFNLYVCLFTSDAVKSRDSGGDLMDISGRSAMMGEVRRCRWDSCSSLPFSSADRPAMEATPFMQLLAVVMVELSVSGQTTWSSRGTIPLLLAPSRWSLEPRPGGLDARIDEWGDASLWRSTPAISCNYLIAIDCLENMRVCRVFALSSKTMGIY